MTPFVDMHCHILPGIDDGPADWQQSLALARALHRAGAGAVIATPHFLPGTSWAAPRDTVLHLVGELQQRLADEQLPLRVFPGMEIAYHRKLEQRLTSGELLPLAGSNHYLIEPPFEGEQDECFTVLSRLSAGGLRLVLAHPERTEGFQRRPQWLEQLAGQGVQMQVNIGSLLGRFGSAARETALYLHEHGMLHFIASDAHDATRRRPIDSQDVQQLHALPHGTALLERCTHNSTRLIAPADRAPIDSPSDRTQ